MSFFFFLDEGRGGGTSSSLSPHGSASAGLALAEASVYVSGESARRRAVRRASRWRRRFVRCRSAVSSGVRKKVSSVSEGRSDHPPGESGLTGWGNAVWIASGDDKVGSWIFEASCGSRSRRASYLCVVCGT